MNKSELLGTIDALGNNVRLVYIFLQISTNQSSLIDLAFKDNKNKASEPGFKETVKILNDPKLFHHSLIELLKTVYKTAFTDSFNITKEYCSMSNQLKSLESQDFYDFWRIVRNCFSHTHRFDFNKSDIKKLPVSWKTATLSKDLQGKLIDTSFFSFSNMWEFFHDIYEFIENKLV